MLRSILIIVLGGLLTWLILRLSRTLHDAVPRPGKQDDARAPVEDDKIIDAEFEDIKHQSKSKET